MGNKQRIYYIDFLKIISMLSVILLHLSNSKWGIQSVYSTSFLIMNFFNSLVRWSVPIFIMCSGAIFLTYKSNLNYKILIKKYILRLIIIYFVWSFLYALLFYIINLNELSFTEFVIKFCEGNYHLWFIPMIIGLYLSVPILSLIINDKQILKYSITLFVIFTIILPTFANFPYFPKSIYALLTKFEFPIVSGYIGYFLLGYYMFNNDLTKKGRYIVYILGLISFPLMFLLTQYQSMLIGSRFNYYYSNMSIFTFIQSVMLFEFAKQINNKIKSNTIITHIINFIVPLSLGIYLIHDAFIVIFNQFGINVLSYKLYLTIPCLSIVIFILSLIVIYVIKKIPLIKNIV